MPFQMSLGEAREALTRAKHSMARVREKAEVAIGQGIEVAEVGATAFGFGYANGRWGGDDGEMKMFGLPVDLGVGIAMSGLAMFGGFGKYGEHGVNVGAGAIAAYSYRTGYQLGAESSAHGSTGNVRSIGSARGARAAMPQGAATPQVQTAGAWDPAGQTFTVHDHAGE